MSHFLLDKKSALIAMYLLLGIGTVHSVHAGPTEIVAMPTGRLDADGIWRNSLTFGRPYVTLSTEATVLPWLQGGFGFVRFMGVPAFVNSGSQYSQFTQNYGDNKDKTIYGRIKLLDETTTLPATALFLRDPIGTTLFKSTAIAASKRFYLGGSEVDLTLGYGTGRIDGVFGGVTATVPAVKGLKVLLEKDAIDYRKDAFAAQSGLINVRQPFAYGLEYSPPGASWSAKLAQRMRTTELQLSFETDNNQRDIVLKKELARFRASLVRASSEQWAQQPAHERVMRELLQSYGFDKVDIQYDAYKVLTLTVSHPRHLHASGAVGDAVHIAMKAGPRDQREIAVRYLNNQTGLAIAHYSFTDLSALSRYITGQTKQADLLPSVKVTDPFPLLSDNPAKVDSPQPQQVLDELLKAVEKYPELAQVDPKQLPPVDLTLAGSFDALGIKRRSEQAKWTVKPLSIDWNNGGDRDHRFLVSPKASLYLNGPGVFQYAIKLNAQYDGRLANKTFVSTEVSQTLIENISKQGIGPNSSVQPNVRSRSAYYEQGKELKLDKAVINRYEQLDQNVYARVNAGLFERSFAGVGAQVLWAPKDASWSADLSIDALAQRSETQMFGLNGYRTVTALGALHYRLPMDVFITARAGRFLAKDVGVRVEFLRRFWGGVELGAWASVTNAKDFGINPGSNYRDKGLMINIPFDAITPNYTRAIVRGSLSPWTRDIAQMVRNPADLYEHLEEDLRSKRVQNGLEYFSGVADYSGVIPMGALAMDEGVLRPIGNAAQTFKREMSKADLGGMATAGALFTLSAALSDRSVNKFASKGSASQVDKFNKLNSASTGLTALGLGAAALWAYDGADFQRSNVALASLEASGAAIVLATGMKYLTGRARPMDGLGASNFGNVPRGSSSFVSRHMALSTALATPFAMHYDAPILYALPALTALARVGNRQHWASDVAAGGALGYVLGNIFYKGHSGPSSQRRQAMFNVTRDSITVTIPTE